ncbi:MAG TPA: hypothetical protein VF079_02445 [Sphingomicrobium sp.]
MSAVLGTLPFLATLWLLVVLGARILEESGAKIAAALKGEQHRRPAIARGSVRIRIKPAPTVGRVRPQWRAAA